MYPPNWKSEIVPRILKRDNYSCRLCGAAKGQIKFSFSRNRTYKVVLCVAHLDHDKENHLIKDRRLLTLCQSCHLNYDNITDSDRISKSINGRKLNPKKKKQPKLVEKTATQKRLEKKYYYWGE